MSSRGKAVAKGAKINYPPGAGGPWSSRLQRLVIDRARPGRGFVHLLQNAMILQFLDLLPNREEMTEGLQMVMLTENVPGVFGLSHPGVIEICAWPRELWRDFTAETFKREQWLLEKLEVPCRRDEKSGLVTCEFTEETARAHQLLGTFLHELGHHRHLVRNRHAKPKKKPVEYTSPYAKHTAEVMFHAYADLFGI
jgi:hypothetical protein